MRKSNEYCLCNARIVMEKETLLGSVLVRDGVITDVSPGSGTRPDSGCKKIDLNGDWLMPGLIELHTDNLEKHLQPRPGVIWPSGRSAFIAHDAQIIASGITTVFDSISVGEHIPESNRHAMLELARHAIRDSRDAGNLRSEHRLHLRCELSDPALPELFEEMSGEPELGLVSLMDHTPGQRQFKDEAAYRTYYQKYKWSDPEFTMHVNRMNEQREKYSACHASLIKDFCRKRGLPMASHDDVTQEHVDVAAGDGMRISEFPTTLEAASRAREKGLFAIMGTPNVLRGGSHSGNVSALEVARKRALGGLSSDYVPASLLPGAYLLYRQAGYTLPEAISLVTANPAKAVGLNDRGSIACGKRADLLRVSMPAIHDQDDEPAPAPGAMPLPEVRMVWRAGERVF